MGIDQPQTMDPKLKSLQEKISKNNCTAVAITSDERIKAVIPMDSVPTFEELKDMTKRYRDCVVHLFDKKEIALEELKTTVQKSARAARVAQTRKLKSGANLLNQEGRVEWAQDAARRRLKNLREGKRPPP